MPSSAGQFTTEMVEVLLGETVLLEAVEEDVLNNVDEMELVFTAEVVEVLVGVAASDVGVPPVRIPTVGSTVALCSTKEPLIAVKPGGYVVTVITVNEQASVV